MTPRAPRLSSRLGRPAAERVGGLGRPRTPRHRGATRKATANNGARLQLGVTRGGAGSQAARDCCACEYPPAGTRRFDVFYVAAPPKLLPHRCRRPAAEATSTESNQPDRRWQAPDIRMSTRACVDPRRPLLTRTAECGEGGPRAAWWRGARPATDSGKNAPSAGPNGAPWTFWSYLRRRWENDNGLRIDHLPLSPALAPRLTAPRRRQVRARRRRRQRPRPHPGSTSSIRARPDAANPANVPAPPRSIVGKGVRLRA